jgi:hypothetical protein
MAYSDFTFELLRERFQIEYREVMGLFEPLPAVAPSAFLTMAIERGLPIALGRGREKARSEMLVAPILMEIREHLNRQISVFSGPEFNVDRKLGLAGFCDFLLARSPVQANIEAPVITIVEAKHENLTEGMPQCLAEMHAAFLFNQKRGNSIETIYGATTSGTAWRFLKLTGKNAEADLTEYHIREVDKILGILVSMISSSSPLTPESL